MILLQCDFISLHRIDSDVVRICLVSLAIRDALQQNLYELQAPAKKGAR